MSRGQIAKKRKRVSFKKIAKSFRGFSTPVFGVSWQPPTSECDIVKKLIFYLEDRRALFYPYHLEIPYQVIKSVLEIRRHLTEIIEKIDANSELVPHFRALRASCRKFLDSNTQTRMRRFHSNMFDLPQSLGELRANFGIQIAQLCVKYGIDIDSEFAMILPPEDKG